MFYKDPETQETYLLNLIDTPWTLSRSLSACQGTLLLIDASQGIQAQTVANFFLAFSENLAVVPVLNKVDLPGSDPQKVLKQIESTFELDTSPGSVLEISAKTGLGVPAVLRQIVADIPPPQLGSPTDEFKALLFDTWYDAYVGVVCLVAVHITQLGIMHPEQTPTPCLTVGQVGYLHLGMKTTRDAHIGDTFYAGNSVNPPTPFPGFKPAKSMVFAGAYPMDASEFPKMQEAIDRLTLNDASVAVARETSSALGQGFRLGFLGTLHMDVFRQRLEEEHDSTVINTAPTVSFQVAYKNESKVTGLEVDRASGRKMKVIRNPAEFPEPDELANVEAFYEPMVVGTLICPLEYVGSLMELCGSHRGEQLEYTCIDDSRVLLKPGYQESDLVKVNLLLNGKPVDALATIVHRNASANVAKEWVKRLKAVMDRQLVEIVIQASINGKVVSRETISALRKDVTAKLYGGDITRKMKLLG
ncbi:GTP-binding protein lepa C-terminus-domain-containing protein [Obelidium mucronatum]|nr:GTP-binding protein lepa C-terminus-domain-containing protein [Obelidium mucronatum]